MSHVRAPEYAVLRFASRLAYRPKTFTLLDRKYRGSLIRSAMNNKYLRTATVIDAEPCQPRNIKQ